MEFLKTAPGDDPIIVEGYFAAAPERVFNAWTNPDIIKKWFGYQPNTLHAASVDLRQGGSWRFLIAKDEEKSVAFEGRYTEIVPEQRLAFTWVHVVDHADGRREAGVESQVEVVFTPRGSGTDVRLVHSAIAEDDMRHGTGMGWEGAFRHMSELF